MQREYLADVFVLTATLAIFGQVFYNTGDVAKYRGKRASRYICDDALQIGNFAMPRIPSVACPSNRTSSLLSPIRSEI